METLKERLIRHEGLRLRPYVDTVGKMTIGVGRCLTTNGISENEAMQMLDNDLQSVVKDVEQALPWSTALDAVRLSVLQEMAFQLGLRGMLAFPKMLAAVRSGDYARAADEIVNSAWHTQTPARCNELAQMMRTGEG